MQSEHIFFILFFSLLVCLIGFLIAIDRRIHYLKKNEKQVFGKIEHKSILFAIYQRLSKFPLTKNTIQTIYKQLEIYEPDNIKTVGSKTIKLVLTNWIISGVVIIVMLWLCPTLLMGVTIGIAIVMYNRYQIQTKVEKEEIKFLESFHEYLESVRHFYYLYHSVEDAIYESVDGLSGPIRYHIEHIYEILMSQDIKTATDHYRVVAPNRFVLVFLSLCISNQKYGDNEENSTFLKNLLELKKDINEELNKRKRLVYHLTGFVPMAIVPMCFLELVQRWAISNISGLSTFYHGTAGILLVVLIIVATIVCYVALMEIKQLKTAMIQEHHWIQRIARLPRIRELLEKYLNHNYGKTLRIGERLRRVGDNLTVREFVLKQMLYTISAVTASIFIFMMIHINTRHNCLYDTDSFINMSSTTSDEQRLELKQVLLKYVNLYKDEEKITKETLTDELVEHTTITNKYIVNILAQEICERVFRYQREYFHWYELLLCLCLGMVAFYIPYWNLLHRDSLVKMDMEDEVIQFQTIIIMLMDIEQISVYEILENLEDYAVIFKKSISECLDQYSAGDIEALMKMKESEEFPGFKEMVDNLMMCDLIGCRKAFDEIWMKRNFNQEKRKFDNERLLTMKVRRASVIAWIPFGILIALYLIVPFTAESIFEFMEYENQLQTISQLER